MTMTIRLASTIVFIGLQETNTIGYYYRELQNLRDPETVAKILKSF
jgi:hypothetical protein